MYPMGSDDDGILTGYIYTRLAADGVPHIYY